MRIADDIKRKLCKSSIQQRLQIYCTRVNTHMHTFFFDRYKYTSLSCLLPSSFLLLHRRRIVRPHFGKLCARCEHLPHIDVDAGTGEISAAPSEMKSQPKRQDNQESRTRRLFCTSRAHSAVVAPAAASRRIFVVRLRAHQPSLLLLSSWFAV